ncbi:hypothetical protein B0H14DRAFT_3495028 [Mycena olivaceomarginata]|nr:hypothetical protein B0H14DRAFT_3495028 [Mycena olivaceomarginata]
MAAYEARHEARRVEKLNALRKAEAVQTKRNQWKAASARYYERHPEVKEKKRLKAAELRAARKLARRRWDPLKRAPRSRVELSHPVPPAASAEILGGYSDTQLQDFPNVAILCHSGRDDASCPDSSVDAMVAESLLDLRAQPRSTLDQIEASRLVVDPWVLLAPQYDSSDED